MILNNVIKKPKILYCSTLQLSFCFLIVCVLGWRLVVLLEKFLKYSFPETHLPKHTTENNLEKKTSYNKRGGFHITDFEK